MKNLQKKQKSLVFLLVVAQLFTFDITPVFSGFMGGPSIPSASSMLSDMERRYHLDTGAIQNQGESMNVASGKALIPEVTLYFSPNDPREGEKITAKAFPMYFSNAENALYYTWTLKRKECDLTDRINDENKFCDEDRNNKITIEDWKITATRIIALNGYTPDLGPKVDPQTAEDNDDYQAYLGGDDKLDMPSHCFINDPSSGKNYELGKASDTWFDCPRGYTPTCMVQNIYAQEEELNITSSADGGASAGGGGGTSSGGTAGTPGSSTGGTTNCTTDGSGVKTCVTTAGSGTSWTGGTGGTGTCGT